MIKGQMLKEVRFREGQVIPKGATVILSWPDGRLKPFQVEVHHGNSVLTTRAASALVWIGLTVTQEELKSAMLDGICETPAGNSVEPDGVDSQGVPSWLVIHGLI
jgi:hypothetical protein